MGFEGFYRDCGRAQNDCTWVCGTHVRCPCVKLKFSSQHHVTLVWWNKPGVPALGM